MSKKDQASLTRAKTMHKVHSNIVQTFMIVFTFFFLTYAYTFTIDLLAVFQVFDDYSSDVWNAGIISMALNCCINPFIYTLR